MEKLGTYILNAGGDDHYRVDVSDASYNGTGYNIELSFAFIGDEVYISYGSMYIIDDSEIDSEFLERKLKKMIMANARLRVQQIMDDKERRGGFSKSKY